MKELRIEIDERTDAALDKLAESDRASKDEVVRLLIEDGMRLRAVPDPLDAIVGSVDAEPVDDIDEVIYGR